MHPHTVCIDLDGTLLTDEWPTLGTWNNGAKFALWKLHNNGFHIVVYSCRLNQRSPYGYARSFSEVHNEYSNLREYFDREGFKFVEIALPWQGKPPATFYIDDKAITFDIHNDREWESIANRIVFTGTIMGASKYPPLSYDRDGRQMTIFDEGV